jgi:hypothetical protein
MYEYTVYRKWYYTYITMFQQDRNHKIIQNFLSSSNCIINVIPENSKEISTISTGTFPVTI